MKEVIGLQVKVWFTVSNTPQMFKEDLENMKLNEPGGQKLERQ